MDKISIAIATFNEEGSIVDCLKSVRRLADEVIVVDGDSKDKTCQLAKAHGARIIRTQKQPMFHINKNLAIEACSGDWILVLDADERISPELAQEIKETVKKWKKGDPVGYWLKRKNFFLTRFLKKGGQYPDPVIRLFKKGKGRHPAVSVHEQIEIDGPVGWLKEDLIHLSSPTLSRYLTRANRYSTLEAKRLLQDKLEINLLNSSSYLVFKPIATFFSLFIRHRGFLDGFPGFVFAFFSGAHHFWVYIKYREMKRSGKTDLAKDWI